MRSNTNVLPSSALAETILQTGVDKGVADVQHWGQQLIEGIKAHNEERYSSAIAMFTLPKTPIELSQIKVNHK